MFFCSLCLFFHWKVDLQVIYNYCLPSKRKRTFSASPSGVVGSQQPPAKRASAYQPSSEASTISKIGQLLHEVEELSVSIPTAADRLSRISSLLPDGHLPSAEVVKELHAMT